MLLHCINGGAALQSLMVSPTMQADGRRRCCRELAQCFIAGLFPWRRCEKGGREKRPTSFGSNDYASLNQTAPQAVDLSERSTG